jgi:hypothetical protein
MHRIRRAKPRPGARPPRLTCRLDGRVRRRPRAPRSAAGRSRRRQLREAAAALHHSRHLHRRRSWPPRFRPGRAGRPLRNRGPSSTTLTCSSSRVTRTGIRRRPRGRRPTRSAQRQRADDWTRAVFGRASPVTLYMFNSSTPMTPRSRSASPNQARSVRASLDSILGTDTYRLRCGRMGSAAVAASRCCLGPSRSSGDRGEREHGSDPRVPGDRRTARGDCTWRDGYAV